MDTPKITLVGAGGLSFGPTMVNDVIHTRALSGSRLCLHDVNAERLARAHRFAAKLNAANGMPVVLEQTTDPARAFDGADFCLSSAEFGRFHYWRQDYEIPRRYGATQVNGENGGPGAVFHSLRSIKNTLGICANIERYCPDAFLVNLSNPMSRVTLAIHRGTKVRAVGMCHEMPIGVVRLGRLLGIPPTDIEAEASGINHFTFFTTFRRRSTGDDLLPRIKEMFARKLFDFGPLATRVAKLLLGRPLAGMLVDQLHTPLVVHMVRQHGLVPCSVDSHIGEYLPFAHQVGALHRAHFEQFERVDRFFERLTTRIADTRLPIPVQRMGHSLEEVIPIVKAMWTKQSIRLKAVNVPNRGNIPNVAEGAIVEVGAVVDGDGVHPDTVPPVAEPIAGHIATQVRLQELIVRSALENAPALALEALTNDPASPPSPSVCRKLFEELRRLQAPELPFSG